MPTNKPFKYRFAADNIFLISFCEKIMENRFQIATFIVTFATFLKHKDEQKYESVDRIWFQICSGGWFQS